MTDILIFGDSITWGTNDWEQGGWADRLKVFIGKNYGSYVYNLGIPGGKTPSLLERFEVETKARVKEDLAPIIIFAIGLNDSYYLHSKNGNVVNFDDFKINIVKLIILARKYSTKIIFIGLTPVEDIKTTPVHRATYKSYKNEYIKKYNDFISSACQDKKVLFVDVFNNWLKVDYTKLLDDGLHPNSEGHEKIFEDVKDCLIGNKLIN